MSKALIVDDDQAFAGAFVDFAKAHGFETKVAATLAEARDSCRDSPPDLVVLDLLLPDGNGLDLVGQLDRSSTRVVVVTGYPSVDVAVRSLRNRVDDFLSKPVLPEQVARILKDAKVEPDSQTPASSRKSASVQRHADGLGAIVGRSPAMCRMFDDIEQVATTDASVLITGETGTGKELVAETIHELSARRRGNFVAINCGALAPELIATELFGHERGSFTGANRKHRGLLERAEGGTVLLDEITEMPMALQVHLLRVLENRSYTPVGGEQEKRLDARILAACNRDPREAIAEKALRADLFYRLNVFPIRVPPLRERAGDIGLLVSYFMTKLDEQGIDRSNVSIESDALALLNSYHWPGNVRELRNAVERAAIVTDSDLAAGHFANQIESEPELPDGFVACRVGMRIDEVERRLLLATLEHCKGSKSEAAKILGVSLKTLYNRLNAYKMEH